MNTRQRTSVRRWMPVAIGAVAALALTGCSGQGAGEESTDHLKIANFLDVTAWDPASADVGFDGPYLSAVYDPLVRLDDDGAPRPGLATSWEWSPNRTELTMELRDGVEFSDGEEFDADAAVAGVEHLMEGPVSGDSWSSVEKVTAVDDHTIELTLSERDDALLYVMGTGRSWMASPKAIEADSLSTAPVGSGPYTLDTEKTLAGSQYEFDRNEDYWDDEDFPYQDLTIHAIGDTTAQVNAMQSGQVNLSYGMADNLPAAKQNDWTIAEGVGSWVGIQFTDRDGDQLEPLGETKVRQAIASAFDGAKILGSIGGGAGTETNQVFAADGPINDPELNDLYERDIDRAKELLDEAGYPDGFEVTMPMSPVFSIWQPAAEKGLEEIGITVTWDDMQQADYQANAATYPMFLAVITAESDPVSNVASQLTSTRWYNPNATDDIAAYPEMQKLVDRVEHTTGDEQLEAVADLNRKATELVWTDVWYQSSSLYFSDDGVRITPVTGLQFPTLDFVTKA